jgi:hypothetical protein
MTQDSSQRDRGADKSNVPASGQAETASPQRSFWAEASANLDD